MSTVVGLKTRNGIILGADTRVASPDGEVRSIQCKKLFRNGQYLIGFIGSVRGGQILFPDYFVPPENIYDFPDVVRKQCSKKGCLGNDDNQMSMHGCNFLIAYKNKLYEMLVDFQMNEVKKYGCIGSGSSYALGSLYATERIDDIELDPEYRVRLALRTAAKYDVFTGAPFHIRTL